MPTPIADFNQLKKSAKKDINGFKETKVALLADSASQLIHQALKGYGVQHRSNYKIFEADYNQIDRQIFDPGSELYEFEPDFLVILRSTERLNKYFYKLPREKKESFAADQADYLDSLYQSVGEKLKCKIIINDFVELNDGVFGNFAAKVKSSFLYQVRKLNVLMTELAQSKKNLFFVDLNSLVLRMGYQQSFDPKMYYGADMVFSIDFLPELAKNIHDIIQTAGGVFKKCIILDLDNTTWGGIIGDDGMEGIQIGDLGSGKIFADLQWWVKQLKNRGIIIAVCSKNTDEIAREPFISHPEMVLRLEDIAIFVANWETKVDNINHIRKVLNIGMDSIVFIDDNPFEREMVKQAIPELTVPDLPDDAAEYLQHLKSLNLFETVSFTEEDEQRTVLYQEEAKRSQMQKSFANEDEFLQSLTMTSEVRAFNAFTIPRVAQLSQRSNQFNLRTVRYSEEDLTGMSKDEKYITFSFTLKDRFGDNGLIAFVVLKDHGDGTAFIENWAMSCRVLKRGMEQFTLNCLVEEARQRGLTSLVGEYVATKKNMMVEKHYPALGFKDLGDNRYRLDLKSAATDKEVFIKKI